MPLAIKNLARSAPPRLPYAAIARQVLGERPAPEVSLAFVSPRRSRALNRLYRGRNKPANILTFSFTPPGAGQTPSDGEILIDLITARAEAKRDGEPFPNYLRHLFIHGLLHLKGFDHGSRMEALERRIINFFSRYGQNHRYRTRRRHRVGQSYSL